MELEFDDYEKEYLREWLLEEKEKLKNQVVYLSYYLDIEFYQYLQNNIEVGDYVKIFDGRNYIWCEVIKKDDIIYNLTKKLINKVLYVKINNTHLNSDTFKRNYKYRYIQFNNIIGFNKHCV